MANLTFDASFTETDYLTAIRHDFTRRAPAYNTGKSGTDHIDLIRTLLSFYPPQYPVLDIACGTGILASELPNNGDGLTGVDLTPAMLSEARAASPQATFVEGRAEALPLPDDTFGSAYICAALVYFADVPAALREARRVLLPGAFLAYQAVTLDSYITGVALQAALISVLGEQRGYATFRLPHGITDTREANVRLMEAAGFVDVRAEAVTVRSRLVIEEVEDWWDRVVMNNAILKTVARLPERELEMVRKAYVQFLEVRRDAENAVEEKVTSWYVCGTKASGPS